MFRALEAATTFHSSSVSMLSPAASPPQSLRRDERRRLRSGTEHEPPAAPQRAYGVAAVSWSACDSPSKYKCDMCAVSEHLHAQVLEFCCSRGAAEKEYRITKAGEPTNQSGGGELTPPIPLLAPPFILLTSDQRKESIKLPSGDRLKVFVQVFEPNGQHHVVMMAN